MKTSRKNSNDSGRIDLMKSVCRSVWNSPVLANHKIRSQMYFGVTLLVIIIAALAAASLLGSLKFRNVTKSIRSRVIELPLAAQLSLAVDNLRSDVDTSPPMSMVAYPSVSNGIRSSGIQTKLHHVETALEDYKYQLENSESRNTMIGDTSQELASVDVIDQAITEFEQIISSQDFIFEPASATPELEELIQTMRDEISGLPELMRQRMDDFSIRVRAEYYTWMALTGLSTIGAFLLLYVLYQRFKCRIFQPLETLLRGSRIVAGGNYDYRIELNTDDEVAELAGALNAMTENFQEIKTNLNQQVRARTKEVVRSEKMASVGFLAAGVAHEINNPLASIAWSAESLETRIYDILNPQGEVDERQQLEQIDDMKKYLQRIQEEAFRCKEITSALLDFSRMGDTQKKTANLSEIVQTVIEMVRPLSKYRDRTIEFERDATLQAQVNSQEIKQVVLNLITNALDSINSGGHVQIQLSRRNDQAVLEVSDNGCGMTAEVMQHLFEPFFTRRRDGQGTGLGLSITYQIIQEHGGNITPHSAGPGLGSTFTVILPIKSHEQKRNIAIAA